VDAFRVLTKTKRVVKSSERWYFLSWLSSIQLRACKPWKTESASRNIGKTLLNATMAREGSVVCTKDRRRGLIGIGVERSQIPHLGQVKNPVR
jgi:hypothetical protein